MLKFFEVGDEQGGCNFLKQRPRGWRPGLRCAPTATAGREQTMAYIWRSPRCAFTNTDWLVLYFFTQKPSVSKQNVGSDLPSPTHTHAPSPTPVVSNGMAESPTTGAVLLPLSDDLGVVAWIRRLQLSYPSDGSFSRHSYVFGSCLEFLIKPIFVVGLFPVRQCSSNPEIRGNHNNFKFYQKIAIPNCRKRDVVRLLPVSSHRSDATPDDPGVRERVPGPHGRIRILKHFSTADKISPALCPGLWHYECISTVLIPV